MEVRVSRHVFKSHTYITIGNVNKIPDRYNLFEDEKGNLYLEFNEQGTYRLIKPNNKSIIVFNKKIYKKVDNLKECKFVKVNGKNMLKLEVN